MIRFVSKICILGFMVSLSSLIVVICVMSGFGSSIRHRLLGQESHLVVQGSEKIQDRNMFFSSVKNILSQESLNSNVERVRFFETQDIVLKSKSGKFSGAVGRGYYAKDLSSVQSSFERNYLDEVNPNMEWDFSLEKNKRKSSVSISLDLAQQLSVFEGDIVFLMPAESLLTPLSELSPPEESLVYSLIDSENSSSKNSKTVFYEIGSLPSLVKTASLSYGVEVLLKDPENFYQHKKALTDQKFQVQSWRDRNAVLFFALKLEKMIMAVFLFLAILISSFSISSMTRLLLAQKKKDIGILIVMGWPIQQVRKLFLGISFTLSLIGLLGGIITAGLVCLFLKHSSIPFFPDIYYNRQIPVEISFSVFFLVSAMALVLAYIASYLPLRSYTLFSSMDLIRKN